MAIIKTEELMKQVGSAYKLVILAAKRTLELSEGKPRFVDAPASTKLPLVALREVQEGKIGYKAKEEGKQ